MFLPMHLVEAIEEFEASRYRAFRRGVWGALTRRSRRMPVLGQGSIERQAYRGVREISLDKVVGSAGIGRPRDLDADFLPTTTLVRPRWIRQYVLLLEGPELPPIDVHKVGDSYFVVDGHHRVSVYRTAGRATIQARVTEVLARRPGAADAGRRRSRSATRRGRRTVGLPLRRALSWSVHTLPIQQASQAELCWSCGQRNAHKLWCPNR